MKRFFVLIVVLFFGVGLGYFLHASPEALPTNPLRLSEEYPYVSPLLLCSSPGAASAEDTDLEAELSKTLESSDTRVSVYYRDLFSGLWSAVNGDEHYAPSSILKIPLAIAYLSLSESDPDLLDLQLEFPADFGDFNSNEYYHAEEFAEPGHTYAVRDLLRLMLIYSDNNAKMLLDAFLKDRYGSDAKQQIYHDFSLSFPEGGVSEEDFMSVQDVGRFFRVLFNATYLSPESSELLLSWLTEGTFDAGLRASVPSSLSVAEKFGENMVTGDDGAVYRELHDCGIIYYPNHPYLLCVMTRGQEDFDVLAQLIQTISDQVYKKTQKEYGG